MVERPQLYLPNKGELANIKSQLRRNGAPGLALDIDETLSWTIGWWVNRMQTEFGNPEGLSVEALVAKYRYAQLVPYWQTEEAIKWMDRHREDNNIQEELPLIENADSVIKELFL